jgi:hypothetical protein
MIGHIVRITLQELIKMDFIVEDIHPLLNLNTNLNHGKTEKNEK